MHLKNVDRMKVSLAKDWRAERKVRCSYKMESRWNRSESTENLSSKIEMALTPFKCISTIKCIERAGAMKEIRSKKIFERQLTEMSGRHHQVKVAVVHVIERRPDEIACDQSDESILNKRQHEKVIVFMRQPYNLSSIVECHLQFY